MKRFLENRHGVRVDGGRVQNRPGVRVDVGGLKSPQGKVGCVCVCVWGGVPKFGLTIRNRTTLFKRL